MLPPIVVFGEGKSCHFGARVLAAIDHHQRDAMLTAGIPGGVVTDGAEQLGARFCGKTAEYVLAALADGEHTHQLAGVAVVANAV